jgi:hypothetical protein
VTISLPPRATGPVWPQAARYPPPTPLLPTPPRHPPPLRTAALPSTHGQPPPTYMTVSMACCVSNPRAAGRMYGRTSGTRLWRQRSCEMNSAISSPPCSRARLSTGSISAPTSWRASWRRHAHQGSRWRDSVAPKRSAPHRAALQSQQEHGGGGGRRDGLGGGGHQKRAALGQCRSDRHSTQHVAPSRLSRTTKNEYQIAFLLHPGLEN